MSERFQILSLDGGGIKGIFSAAVLAHFEEDLSINIIDHFDLIVGTSTGGIIALGLGLGMKPRAIVDFYIKEGHKIFYSRFGLIKQLFHAKYKPINLENALKEYFGEKTLGHSLKRLIIPSYNIGEDDIYLFRTPHHERLRRDYKIPMWKVGMATSAAPTYFPSFKKIDHQRLVDGGVWANNPTMIGIVEAVSVLEIPLQGISVFSLGTTDELKGRPSRLDSGGFLQWGFHAIDVVLRGQSIGTFRHTEHLLGKDKVLRLNPKVPDGLFKLDKLSEKELMAKAAHESRHLSHDLKTKFIDHKAPEFKPIYVQ